MSKIWFLGKINKIYIQLALTKNESKLLFTQKLSDMELISKKYNTMGRTF